MARHAPPPILYDLLVEILCRLPVKSLMQLHCVCKSWNSLISDPKFAKLHLQSSPSDFTRHHLISRCNCFGFALKACPLLAVFDAVPPPATYLGSPVHCKTREIVGSCNGILCFAIDDNFAYLWNPSTQSCKILPSLENSNLESSFTTYGFGYDQFADAYKVVAVFTYGDYDTGFYTTQVKVHTLGTDSWRRIEKFPTLCFPTEQSAVFVSGTLNWLSYEYDDDDDDCDRLEESNMVIISLDLGNECYQQIFNPVYHRPQMSYALGVLRDCLCLLCWDFLFDVLLMKEYGNEESWTKLFQVKDQSLTTLHIFENDEMLLWNGCNLCLHNFKDHTFKYPQIPNINWSVAPHVYVESLISPCS